jgi:hypothetical protein
MIDWVTIKPTAKGLIADLTQLGSDRVLFADEAEGGTWSRDPHIRLTIFGLGEIGHQEERYQQPVLNDTTDDLQVNIVEQKRFTLSVRCEGDTQDIADPMHAGSILETLKTRLRRPTSAARMQGIFAIADYRPTKRVDYRDQDGRQVSAYVMDLACTTVDNDADDTPGAGGFVNETIINGTVSGVTLPTIDTKGS